MEAYSYRRSIPAKLSWWGLASRVTDRNTSEPRKAGFSDGRKWRFLHPIHNRRQGRARRAGPDHSASRRAVGHLYPALVRHEGANSVGKLPRVYGAGQRSPAGGLHHAHHRGHGGGKRDGGAQGSARHLVLLVIQLEVDPI